MDNKRFWLGMLVIALVFGMTVLGCDDDSTNDKSNSYKGDWSGTFTKDGTEVEAKITFTDTTWTLTAGTININGTYTKNAIQATLSTVVDGASYPVATGTILLTTLTVTFNAGTHNGSSGSFTRVKDAPTDTFKGTWNGSLSKSGTTENATIVFADTDWTLTVGSETSTGTYTKSIIGYTATLTAQTAEGQFTVGTCIVNPVKKELTVNISGGSQIGKTGKFTRAQ
jgi:hypothetical protein